MSSVFAEKFRIKLCFFLLAAYSQQFGIFISAEGMTARKEPNRLQQVGFSLSIISPNNIYVGSGDYTAVLKISKALKAYLFKSHVLIDFKHRSLISE